MAPQKCLYQVYPVVQVPAAIAEQRADPVRPKPQSHVQVEVQGRPLHAVTHLLFPKKLQMMVLSLDSILVATSPLPFSAA